MPIVETVYRRTAQLDWTEVVTCPHCQMKWKGGVIARGFGRDRTTYGLGAESAFQSAGVDAFANAVDAGKLALLRARCPRCHKRGGGVVSLVIKTVLFYGFMVGLFVSIAGSMARSGAWAGGSSPRLLPVLIVLALVLIPLTIVGRLRSVDQRVRSEPVQELVSEPAPPPARPRPARAPVAAAPATPSAADSDSLELDTDRSWNKKG